MTVNVSQKNNPAVKRPPQQGSTKRPTPSQGKQAPGPKPIPHVEDVVALSLFRNRYSIDRHYIMMRVLIGLIIAIIISLGLNVYLATREPEFRYFATSANGTIIPIQDLRSPIQTKEELLNWTANAVVKSLTFSFANYRQDFQEAMPLFTSAGWEAFNAELVRSNLINTVVSERYVVTTVLREAPVIVSEGVVANGVYGWKIQIPVVMTFQARGTQSRNLLAEVVVIRRPVTENPKGLGIASFIAE